MTRAELLEAIQGLGDFIFDTSVDESQRLGRVACSLGRIMGHLEADIAYDDIEQAGAFEEAIEGWVASEKRDPASDLWHPMESVPMDRSIHLLLEYEGMLSSTVARWSPTLGCFIEWRGNRVYGVPMRWASILAAPPMLKGDLL